MNFKDMVKWNTRASVVYAVGVWTMIVSYGVLKYTGRYDDRTVKEEELQEPENPNKVVYQTAHSKSVITYKKDFVPYTTRISNFFKSFSSEPGSRDSDK